MKKKISVAIISIAIVITFSLIWKFFSTSEVSNTRVSGMYLGNQMWGGNILVTGDVEIFGNLTVREGTTVRFVVGDDRGRGDEVPADGYNTNDPTRLLSYGKTHSGMFVWRKLIAKGSDNHPITFTSAAKNPSYADWESIVFEGNGSLIDKVIVEYSRNGLNPIGDQTNSIIRNSIIRHTFWGAVSSGQSPIQVLNNHLYDCGHEGVDIQQGKQIVRGNLIEDCHAGIVILAGNPVVEGNKIKNCGDGIHVDPKSHSTLSNNMIIPADSNKNHKYTYQQFSYSLFGD